MVKALEEAIALAEGGRKEEAEARLRALVAEGARLPKAAMALGVLCGERGDHGERNLWLLQARRLEEVAGEPPSLRLLLNLLVDAIERGEPEQALAYGQEALVLYEEDGELHLQLARVLLALGKEEEGQAHLEQACAGLRARLARQPEDAKGWRLLAMAEQNAERVDDAIEAYRQALAADPNHLPSLLAIGELLILRGLIDEAMLWLMNALAVAPMDAKALSMAGLALSGLGDRGQAIELYRKALSIDPTQVKTCCLLGAALNDQGLYSEAEQAFRDGLATDPHDLDCRMNLASTLRNRGDLEGAAAMYRELVMECKDALGAFNNLMFTLSISDGTPPSEMLATAEAFWGERIGQAETTTKAESAPMRMRVQGRPVRVGLLSADIGNHVVGRFLDPLLRHHNANRCQLELISMHRRYEESSEELIGLADGFQSLEGLPSAQARALLRQQNYDLIVDTSGYTRGSGLHLLAERCAPVQAHYIGYHATTGLPTIDWFIGDEETAAPELQDQFSERLWRLPRTWLAYSSRMVFPEAKPMMETDRPIFGCFSQIPKISDTTLSFWGEALRRVPSALLLIKDRGVLDAGVRRNLEKRLKDVGVEPDRLIFLPPTGEWSHHVELYNIVDIALDTTPWSSATTCFEALAMGTPVIAIRGNRLSARMSSSIVKGFGMADWIATSPTEYGEKIYTLCNSLPMLRLKKLYYQGRYKTSQLSNTEEYGKELELELRKLIEK